MSKYSVYFVLLNLCILPCAISTQAQTQSQQPPVATGSENGQSQAPGTTVSSVEQPENPRLNGSTRAKLGNIKGTVFDQTGTAMAGARIGLTREDQSLNQEVVSADDGQFFFTDIAPGPFQLMIGSTGFSTQTFSGMLHSGETYTLPQTTLTIATAVTEVRVVPSRVDVAEDEIKIEEKQRVLGVVPNYYVSYIPNAVPLSHKQKFELAWKTTIDPVNFGLTAGIAGFQQAQNDFSGYGQGAQGYAKRFGASYADFVTSTWIGSAVLPSILKQDPRYFYKGTGSKKSRILYAIANAVICKGDNGRWQANYSSILGSLAAGGISNLYYPAKDREGAELTFENTVIGIGATAAANILQEFVVRRLTPSASNHGQKKSQDTNSNISTWPIHAGD